MILVNGMNGIGTGFSTSVPKYDILDVIKNMKRKIMKKSQLSIAPSCNGFKGKIIKIDNKNFILQGELAEEAERCKPLLNRFANGDILNESESQKLNEYANKTRPMSYNMLQHIIAEPKMSYEDIAMMMDVIDQNDTDTLLSYVSIMTSEKARAMKLIYDKRIREAEMISQ